MMPLIFPLIGVFHTTASLPLVIGFPLIDEESITLDASSLSLLVTSAFWIPIIGQATALSEIYNIHISTKLQIKTIRVNSAVIIEPNK
jgi:hypothetical protein